MAGLGTTMLSSAVALTLAATAPHAHLAPPLLEEKEAQRKLDAGLEEFYAEDFEAAAALFAEAYALEPQPFLLYSWAQAERYANNCPKAVELFERFLRTDPPSEEAQRARQKIVECGGIPPRAEDLAKPDVPPPPALRDDPTAETPPPSVTPSPPPPDQEPTKPVRPGRALIFTGVGIGAFGAAMGATGGFLVVTGEQIREDAPSVGDHDAFVVEMQRGTDRKRTGVIVGSVGAGLFGVGAALLIAGLVSRQRGTVAWRPHVGGLAINF